MIKPQMVMYEEEFNQIQAVVDRLVRDANAKVVFIVDKNGQLIAAAGDIDNVDTTSLASLTAGNIAATGSANLAANSLIERVPVDPIDVDFVRPLTKAPGRAPNIFFFVIDSLRRDYVSAYNPAVTFTPSFGKFAAENLRSELFDGPARVFS